MISTSGHTKMIIRYKFSAYYIIEHAATSKKLQQLFSL